MNTFYKYYSGEKVAPVTTLFIGGNHEASSHLWELPCVARLARWPQHPIACMFTAHARCHSYCLEPSVRAPAASLAGWLATTGRSTRSLACLLPTLAVAPQLVPRATCESYRATLASLAWLAGTNPRSIIVSASE
jgi:hypothetical protein